MAVGYGYVKLLKLVTNFSVRCLASNFVILVMILYKS